MLLFLVLDKMTWSDQTTIQAINQHLNEWRYDHRERKIPKIFIVHNWKDIKDDNQVFKNFKDRYVNNLFVGEWVKRDVFVDDEEVCSESFISDDNNHHFFLCNANYDLGRDINEKTIQDILHNILSSELSDSLRTSRCFLDHLAKTVYSVLNPLFVGKLWKMKYEYNTLDFSLYLKAYYKDDTKLELIRDDIEFFGLSLFLADKRSFFPITDKLRIGKENARQFYVMDLPGFPDCSYFDEEKQQKISNDLELKINLRVDEELQKKDTNNTRKKTKLLFRCDQQANRSRAKNIPE